MNVFAPLAVLILLAQADTSTWERIADKYGVPFLGLAIVLGGLAWCARKALSEQGWIRVTVSRWFVAQQTHMEKLDELLAKQTASLGSVAETAGTVVTQHTMIVDAGLHACDVAELALQRMELPEALEPLGKVRVALERVRVARQ